MAISESMSNPNDWLFQNDFPHTHIDQIQTSPPNTFDLSTAAASRANSSSNGLGPEQGRVAKPIRRRSRASRRTPTTLFNTDTTNFRAMVQHFTGGPAAAVSFAASPQAPNLGAAAGYMDHAAGAGLNFHVQQQQQHMFVMDNVHGGGVAAPGSGNRINYDNYMV